jgi:aminodeoxyfutalosine synthase
VNTNRDDLRAFLASTDLHGVSRRADELRRERYGHETSYAVIDHLSLENSPRWCPVCGEELTSNLRDVSPRATEVHVLPPAGAPADEMVALLSHASDLLRSIRASEPEASLPATTLQVGTLSDLATAADVASLDDAELLMRLVAGGLRQVSDGIRPGIHPGVEQPSRWERFWRAAASAGLRGHAAVLYGPDHPEDDILRQIEAIGTLQGETGVFLSVTPIIHAVADYGGVQDNLLTHGSQDLKVLAACRLGLAHVPHVRVAYNRSDLKLAHVSVACGADDVDGHLELADRDRTADADAFDLSVREIPLWLREAGFAPRLRNGMYESVAEGERSSSPTSSPDASPPSSSSS